MAVVMTGVTLDPIGAQVLGVLIGPELAPDEQVEAFFAEDVHLHRVHVVTQRRVICLNKQDRLSIAYEFDVAQVVRTQLGTDEISDCVYVSLTGDGLFLMRVSNPTDAKLLAMAIVGACERAIRSVQRVMPLIASDDRADFMLASGFDHWQIVIGEDEVRARDTSSALAILAPMLTDPRLARRGMEAVSLGIDGYNDRPEELWEIAEVRMFVQRLDAQFPYWFYFLDKHFSGLFAVMRCVLPADVGAHHDRLQDRLSRWWLPAMSTVAKFAGLDEAQLDALGSRGLAFVSGGPQRM